MATMLSASPPTCKTLFLAQRLSCTNPTASILNWVSFVPRIPQNPMTLSIECSSRPRKKGTAHHNKTRPKKHSLSDKKRKGPTYYPPLERPPSYYPPLPRALNPFTISEQKGHQPPPAVSSANAEQSPSSVVVPEVL